MFYKNQWLNLDTGIAYFKFDENLERIELNLYDNKSICKTVLYGKKDIWNYISKNNSTFNSEELVQFERFFLENV